MPIHQDKHGYSIFAKPILVYGFQLFSGAKLMSKAIIIGHVDHPGVNLSLARGINVHTSDVEAADPSTKVVSTSIGGNNLIHLR